MGNPLAETPPSRRFGIDVDGVIITGNTGKVDYIGFGHGSSGGDDFEVLVEFLERPATGLEYGHSSHRFSPSGM